MQNPNKVCEFCSEEFTPKRTDARHCGRRCQSTSNNRAKAKDEEYLKPIIKVIKKNRTILKQIFEDSKIENNIVSDSYLKEIDFKLGYLTMHLFNQQTSKEIHFVGDYSIEQISINNYKVEKR